MEVLLAHPGTQYSYHLAAQLYRHDVLYRFWTGLALSSDSRLGRFAVSLLPQAARRRISARIVSGVPPSRLRSMPSLEWRAAWNRGDRSAEQLLLHERNRRFQEAIPDRDLRSSSAVVGFDTSSWILMERAREANLPVILDQSICHPLSQQTAFSQARSQFPDWNGQFERREPLVLNCEETEHRLATRIVAASHYTKCTLVEHGVRPDKIIVNPYGVDLDCFRPPESRNPQRPFRFVFVGSVGVRKGVPLLLRAWEALSPRNAELWVVGPVPDSVRCLLPPLRRLTVVGKRSHAQLPALLRDCDVLVLPSYAEGFGLVLLEAMACGLPVITTTATAGPELIQDGLQGFVIAPGDLDGLVHSMRHFLENPEQLPAMSRSARARAVEFSWDAYGDRWLNILRELH